MFLIIFSSMPNNLITVLKKIQRKFLSANYAPKVKHDALCYDYKEGGLKTKIYLKSSL